MSARIPLTEQEENVIKDILKVIGNNDVCSTAMFLSECKLTNRAAFDDLCDSIFNKLGNGRLTVIEENQNPSIYRHPFVATPNHGKCSSCGYSRDNAIHH